MTNFQTGTLGRTGLSVGRLGVAASYGAPAAAFEAAFERGCNYFSIGSGRRSGGMRRAIQNLRRQGRRDRLVIAVHTYARVGTFTAAALNYRLRSLGVDYADVLVLGWHNRAPSTRLLENARRLRAKGLFRFLGMSGHQRSLFPNVAATGDFDLFHVRYNAAHRGAETDVFPLLTANARPGIVTYTATRWGHLLDPAKMPPATPVPAASDCYRFVLSNPAVDVCLCGPRDMQQMQAALETLARGPLAPDERLRLERIGDFIHTHKKGFFD